MAEYVVVVVVGLVGGGQRGMGPFQGGYHIASGPGIGSQIGLFDPDLTEGGRFFAARIGGADRQAAGNGAEKLEAGACPEKARALENGDFAQITFKRYQQTNTGKSDISDIGGRGDFAEIEHIGRISEAALEPVFDDAHAHRGGKDRAAMQRL